MNHSTATLSPTLLLNKLVKKYIIASSLLALLIIAGYWLIQWELSQHSSDAHLINIAVQQRILSETLCKTALLIQLTSHSQQRSEYIEDFRRLQNLSEQSLQELLQFDHTHTSLLNNSSALITRLFVDLQPRYDALNVAAQKLLATAEQPNAFLEPSSEFAGLIQKIVTEQKALVPKMDLIMSQYESEALAHINHLWWLMTVIVMITLMVLLFEGQYIFRPTARQLQQRLQDSFKNILLETALDKISSLISLKDIQGSYLFINRAFERQLQTTKAEFIGKNDHELFPAEAAKQFQAHDIKVLEAETAFEFEEQLPLDEGLHTYLTVKFPVYDDAGNLHAVGGISTDITERKQTELALQDSEAMLRALLNAIPESALLMDQNRIILDANKTAAQRLKVPLEKLIGHPAQEFIPPNVLENRNKQLDKVFASGRCIDFEDQRDGWYFHHVICPIATPKNAIAKVAIVAIDITPYKQAQLKLSKLTEELEQRVVHRTQQLETINQELQAEITSHQQTEMALKVSEERYRRIVETAQEGIWVIDAKAKTTFVNQSMADILGYRIEDMLDRPIFDFMDEAACLEAEQYFERCQFGIKEKHDFRFQSKTGSELWTIISAAPLLNEPGDFTGALGMVVDITKRKRMEEQLRSSEELHRVILSNISDGVFITDDNGQFTYLCPNIENFIGFSVEEVQEFGNLSKLLADNCILFEELKQKGEIQNLECQMRNQSGHLLSLLVNVKRVSIKEGTILYSCRNITELKQAEQNFKQLVENAPDAMVIVNQQGTIVFVNAQTEKLFGYARTDLLGKPLNRLIPERCRDKHNRHWDSYFNNPCSRSMGIGMEIQAVRQEGSEFPVEISLSPIETTEGLLVSSTLRDISERKQVEKTLRNIVEGVSSTIGTNFFQKLVEYLAQMLQVKYALIGQLLTEDPKILKALSMVADNPSMMRSEYDLRNTPCEEIFTGHIPGRCSYSQGVQQNFSSPLLVQMGIESCVGMPLLDADGQVMGLIAIMNDKPLAQIEQIESLLQIFAARAASELERIQALETLEQERASLAQRVEERTGELMIANMKLARAVRLKDEFLANMSHELRTPLNAILGISEALQDEVYGTLSQQQAKSLHTLEDSGRHLLSLINDILELAKMEAGKVKLEIIPIYAESMADTCLHLVKQLAMKKLIKIFTTFDINVTKVQADQRYLKQMLLNLLSNAIKFTPERGQVNLEIRGHLERGLVEFIVSDTGIGIAEKDMEYLFQPFVQLDGSLNRAHEGTGLGLSLVSRLAEMHGGSVSVESEVDKGSRFTISLPWQPMTDERQSNKDIDDRQSDKAAKVQHTSAVILLVDDNPSVIETLSDYLQTKGYRVTTAFDGVQAIDRVTEVHPNLILMDIQMPTMNGLEAIRQIRANAKTATIPIIALTALAMPGDKERCLEAGANDYLSKPVSFKGLVATIERML